MRGAAEPRRGSCWRAALALLAAACLGGCGGGAGGIGPGALWRDVTGASNAARPEPPGLDRPFPSLHSVPPRPERPSPESRDAITAALAGDRDRSREPLALRAAPGGGERAASPGMAAGPPPRPAIAAAPRVPWTEAAQPTPTPRPPPARGGGTPAAETAPAASPARTPAPRPGAPGLPEMPDAAPAPPPAELLGAPPPPPSPDLLAPAPPARR